MTQALALKEPKWKIRPQPYFQAAPIELPNGAIIIPIRQNPGQKKSRNATEKLIDFLVKNSWSICKFRDQCIAAVLAYDGFSCKLCPHKDKPENFFYFNHQPEDLAEDALECAKILKEVFHV